MRYGFVGLGHLGGHLAADLRRAGFPLTVTDLNRGAADPLLALGAAWADDPQAVAERADAVLACLPSPAASRSELAGPRGLLAGMREGSAWIEMSTNDAEHGAALAALAAGKGVAML
jgi:3-hydroxyisobutyrate dehydrogenase